ncbi:MAG: acyltransferase family protein [Fibrobacterota bacterium]|nr:MAG: acyltransferase family protein [Fibrobacterota bacterium]
MKDRDISIDIMKGLAILAIVWGHAGIKGSGFFYLFHVPLFFILSGYMESTKTIENFASAFKKKVKALYLPYVAYGLIFLLIRNFSVDLKMYSEYFRVDSVRDLAKNLFFIFTFNNVDPIFLGPLWFVFALFVANGAFFFLLSVTRNIGNSKWNAFLILCVALAVLLVLRFAFPGAHLSNWGNTTGETLILAIAFVATGFLLKGVLQKKNTGLVLVSFLLLCSVYRESNFAVDVRAARYDSLLELGASSLLGFYFTKSIAEYLGSWNNWATRYLAKIGQYSFSIMALHLLGMKFSQVLVVAWQHDWDFTIYTYALVPHRLFGFLYFAAGVLGCLVYIHGKELIVNQWGRFCTSKMPDNRG